MNICIVEKDIKEIELMKPLWEQLNAVHFAKSVYFKSKYEKFTFDKRIESIYKNEYRKFGLGGKLMEKALNWFKSKEITNIEISNLVEK